MSMGGQDVSKYGRPVWGPFYEKVVNKTVGLIKGFFLRWQDKLSTLYLLKYCFALKTNVAGMWRYNDL